MQDEQIGAERPALTPDGHGDGMTGPQVRAVGDRQAVLLTKADEERVSIRIQPDVAFGNFQRALQRALDLAALSLQAIPVSESLPELGTFPGLRFASRLSLESLQAEYPLWIMGHALTDIVESLEPLITDTIKICRLASLNEAGTVDKNLINRAIDVEFEKAALGSKLAKLAQEAPGVLTGDLQLALKALNKLRVCLTHAGGRVREIDCYPNDALELSYIFWEFFVEYADGAREALHSGLVTKDEGWIVMCRSREPRFFQVGEKIQLSKQDLFRIAATIFHLVCSLRANLYAHLRKTCAEDFKEQPLRLNFRAAFSDALIGKQDEPTE